jgi:hypothetical protein
MTPKGRPYRFIPCKDVHNTLYDKSTIYNRSRFTQPETMLNRDRIIFMGSDRLQYTISVPFTCVNHRV